MSNVVDIDDQAALEELEDGEIYSYKNGVLEKLERDPDDLKKVRMMNDAFDEVLALQKRMRKELEGYKPDITAVVSALVVNACKEENAPLVVKSYLAKMFAS
ncbi:hypothetical protein H0A36_17655 [Endozoicomonas sp. SM1973]|uniref:Uncharacterized protein n=1 Tax=Spartinivicinus marinus TaxID=2994442 RepID=A0A853I372_9GAMM|nr:hypothetical protein [Spartinivicinus marinus]MCX4030200.1 hypothetical protein [Spartinivicinus marinus]NYZ67843.1 hypothetical protein [Spartinivicinus marinus]